MILLNALLAGGLIAAAVPVAVHLIHRRRITQVEWGAMRFLIDLFAVSRRRILMDEIILMLLRIGILACVALALARPAFETTPDVAIVQRPAEKISAVLVIDTSMSSALGRGDTRLQAMQTLAQAYLETLREGDEVSLITTADIDQPAADPSYDLTGLARQIEQLEPVAQHSDVPALLDAARRQLRRHLNPGAEIVLITDGLDQGWETAGRSRWNDIQDGLTAGDEDRLGTLARPRVVVLHPPALSAGASNLAVTAIRADRSLIDTRNEIGIIAEVRHVGAEVPAGLQVSLQIGERVVDTQPLPIAEGQTTEVAFRHQFTDPGQHAVTVSLVGARDWLAADDQRSQVLRVIDQLPVLLIEDQPGDGRQGSMALTALALAPHTKDERNRIALTRVAPDALTRIELDDYRAVILGEVEALGATVLGALERYVAAGGGVLITLGERSRPELMNRLWARAGDGLLPVPLTSLQQAEDPAGAHPAFAAIGHPALAAFVGTTAEAWREIAVHQWMGIDESSIPDGSLTTLLRLDSGDPLLVERRRGLGRVVVCTTSLTPAWSDMALRRSFVPLIHGIIGHLGSIIQPPRNLSAGERLVHAPSDAATSMDRLHLVAPSGDELVLASGTWQGRRVVTSTALREPGVYHIAGDAEAGAFAVAIATEESGLTPLDESSVSRALARVTGVVRAETTGEVAAVFGNAERGQIEIWAWLICVALGLFVAESCYTRFLAAREGGGRHAT